MDQEHMAVDERERKDKVDTKGRNRKRMLLVAGLIAVILIGAGSLYYYLSEFYLIGMKESLNVLCYGVDSKAGIADSLAVASLNPVTKSIDVIALPGSTVIGDDSAVLGKTYESGGEEALKSAVEKFLNAPIHNVVRLDFAGFADLIDSLGGVMVNIEDPITYRHAGEVVFSLAPGHQVLSGEAALRYVRYLGPNETEADRFRRQKAVISAIGESLSQKGWLNSAARIAELVRYCETDLTVSQLVKYGSFVRRQQMPIEVSLLPGEALEIGWVPDIAKVAALAAGAFHNPSWRAATR